jgi:hypothetical protein
LILCGVQLVLQAAILDCGSFDPFSFQQDGLSAAEVNVGLAGFRDAVLAAQAIKHNADFLLG